MTAAEDSGVGESRFARGGFVKRVVEEGVWDGGEPDVFCGGASTQVED